MSAKMRTARLALSGIFLTLALTVFAHQVTPPKEPVVTTTTIPSPTTTTTTTATTTSASVSSQSDFSNFLSWLKLIGGIVGMIFGIGGTIFYYRAVIALKTNDAAKSAIDMYKNEIDAARMSRERVYQENSALTTAKAQLQAELAAAKERTDLSAVMANQREALKQNAELNRAIVDTLTALTSKGDKQYQEAVTFLQVIMKHLNDMAEENKIQLSKNSESLATVLAIVGRVEKMWVEMSRRVDRVEQHEDAVSDRVDDNAEKIADITEKGVNASNKK